ncbi:hypothetical protein ACLOJK_029813 [Asimina triloba]
MDATTKNEVSSAKAVVLGALATGVNRWSSSAKTDNITLWDPGEAIWTLQVTGEEVQTAPRPKIVTVIVPQIQKPWGIIIKAGP